MAVIQPWVCLAPCRSRRRWQGLLVFTNFQLFNVLLQSEEVTGTIGVEHGEDAWSPRKLVFSVGSTGTDHSQSSLLLPDSLGQFYH